jgi:hypothetical protein
MFSCIYDHFGIGVGIETEHSEPKCERSSKPHPAPISVISPNIKRIQPTLQISDSNNKLPPQIIRHILFYQDNLHIFPNLYSFPDKECEKLKPYLDLYATLILNEHVCNANLNNCLDYVAIILQEFSKVYYKVYPKKIKNIDPESQISFQSHLYSQLKYTTPLFINDLSKVCDAIDTFSTV